MGHSLDQEKGRCSFFLEFSLLHLLPHWFPPLGSGIRGERTGENNYLDSAGAIFFLNVLLAPKWTLSLWELVWFCGDIPRELQPCIGI